MTKPSRDLIWGFFAPITPLAPLIYVFSSARTLKSVIRNLFRSDHITRYLLLALLATSAISSAAAPNPLHAIGSTLVLLIFLLALGHGVWGIKEPRRFLKALVLGGGLLGLVVVLARALGLELSLFGVPVLTDFTGRKPRGGVLGIESNGLAALLEPAVIGGLGLAMLERKRRTLYMAAGMLALAGIFVTFSRGSMVGISVAIALMLTLQIAVLRTQWKIAVASLVAVAIAAALMIFAVPGLGERIASTISVSHNIERIHAWTGTWHMILDHPLFGSGPGNFGEVYPDYKVPEARKLLMSPHSLYLYLLSGWGFLGFFAFFGLLLRIVLPPLLKSPTRLQLLAIAMATPFWIHVIFDDLFVLHVPLIMGCVANGAMRLINGDPDHPL